MATKKVEGKKEELSTAARSPEQLRVTARMALRPSVNAAAVISAYGARLGVEDTDVGALIDRLAEDVKDVWVGDTRRAEAMLFGQAHALQSIFMELARRASRQEYLKHWEAYLRMALKAQNQCRMTLETLATIKNPPVVIARQANINNGGQQQVNNGATHVPPNASHMSPADAEATSRMPEPGVGMLGEEVGRTTVPDTINGSVTQSECGGPTLKRHPLSLSTPRS